MTVVIEADRYVLQGLVKGMDHHEYAIEAMRRVEGLDMLRDGEPVPRLVT